VTDRWDIETERVGDDREPDLCDCNQWTLMKGFILRGGGVSTYLVANAEDWGIAGGGRCLCSEVGLEGWDLVSQRSLWETPPHIKGWSCVFGKKGYSVEY